MFACTKLCFFLGITLNLGGNSYFTHQILCGNVLDLFQWIATAGCSEMGCKRFARAQLRLSKLRPLDVLVFATDGLRL